MAVALDRADRAPERPGHVGFAHVREVAHRHDFALAAREPSKRDGELLAIGDVVDLVGDGTALAQRELGSPTAM